MKKYSAFTYVEVMIVFIIIIIIALLTIPSLINRTPPEEKARLKTAYMQTISIVNQMTNNIQAFPNSDTGLADTQNTTIDGQAYGGTTKFAEVFKLHSNVIDDEITIRGNFPQTCTSEEQIRDQICNGGAPFDCFMLDNQVTYCLPTGNNIFGNSNNERAVIRFYIKPGEYDNEKANYMAVDKKRKSIRCTSYIVKRFHSMR